MKHIVCFSGGKDSTALILWAKDNLPEFTAVFCDTGWEHPLTIAYIAKINAELLNGELVTLRSVEHGPPKHPVAPLRKDHTARDAYRWRYVSERVAMRTKNAGMRNLVQIKKRVPSVKARFCTSELKVLPMIEWLKTQNDEMTIYQGIRADESENRSKMSQTQWSDDYDAMIERPLISWNAAQCFALMAEKGVKPNPLYLLGAGRVGCFPCVMVNQRELKALMKSLPEIKGAIAERSFFPPNYIPSRFHTGHDPKSGKSFPKCKDVFRYIEKVDEDQLPMFAPRSCMSVYNLCE